MPIWSPPFSLSFRAGGSITAKLRTIVWLMVLPTLLLSVIAGIAVFRAERRAVVNAALETAEALSLVTDREMAVRTALLKALTVSPSLREGRLQDFYREAARLADGSTNTIVLVTPDGQQLINTRIPWGQPLTRSPAFATGMQSGRRLIVSDLFHGPVDERYTFAVRVPVTVNGQAMLLGYGSPATELQQIFRDQPLPEGWLGVVLDRQGRVAARTRDPERRVGQVASDAMRQAIATTDRGVVDARTLDGVPVFTVFSRAPDSGWVVLIGLDRAELAKSAWAAFALTLSISTVFILVALWMVRRMARDIVEPLQKLREDAIRMGGGETVADGPTGVEEIDTVQHALATASRERAGSEHRLRAEIDAAVAETRSAQQAALRSQKLEALGRLTGGIAHDFNNLLQTMTTGLELARRLNSEPRGDAALAACQRATGKASQLTRQLLAFGRQQVGHEAVIDLRRQLPDLMELVGGAVGSAVEVHFKVDDALWSVKTDPVQLELAVLNLALNARDAMHGRGRLSVAADNQCVQAGQVHDLTPGEYVRIVVTDNGDGMNAEQISRAFEPFFTTKPVGQGTGLGLAQVYALARGAGGAATIHSKVGLGTEVAVWLPRTLALLDDAPAAAAPGQNRRYRGRVMLVEDDASVRELTAQSLEDLGFSVVTAPTADQALDLLRGGTPVDVVLSDIVMPGTRSGVDLARTLRVLKPTLPVVLASGHPVRIEEAPDVPLVAKPYEIHAVAAKLAEAMNQAGVAANTGEFLPGT
ncbi:ATP-binding protein [Roseateles amylovorans]|uniref:histidine kinase n=1 Tax=Roseateles amylovorans TaxID=2978473 RepID=A0ABY6B5X2_9BURK|nr:ATP-binding protein [Roseateles amylovorans]UXH80575.1 ATP-binding protein [Roseateles amylovorans]